MREVEVVLDHPDSHPTYTPGAPIRGHVILHLSKQTTVRKVQVSLGWHTTGRGDTAEGVVDTFDLPGRTYEPGRHQIPFEFVMPAQGPPSYEGHLIHVHWHVKASVDIPWAKDPSDLASFRFDQNHAWIDAVHGQAVVQEHTDLNRGWTMLILAVVGVVVTLIAIGLGINEEDDFFCCAVISLGATLFFAYIGTHRFLATRLIKDAKMHPDAWPAILGDTFRYHFEFDAGAKMKITQVQMTLTCTESATYTRGTDTVTDTHTLYEETLTVGDPNKSFAKAEHAHYTGQWHLKGFLPPTLSLYRNAITWEVAVSVDIPNWPDWKEEVEVLVERLPQRSTPSESPEEPTPMF